MIQIPNYQIERKIGSGKFGVVYLATHKQFGSKAAIKIMQNPEYIQFLRVNGIAQANLTHENIVRVLTGDVECENPYIIMEYCKYGSLEGRLKTGYGFSEDEIRHTITQAAKGIGYAHSQNVIHGDIKPANILFQNGAAKVSDFGLCEILDNRSYTDLRLSREQGKVIGTGKYVAPEVYETGQPTVQSDIFSLGVVMFDMLDKSNESEALERIAEKAASVRPQKRYQSLQELLREIKEEQVTSKPLISGVYLEMPVRIEMPEPSKKESREERILYQAINSEATPYEYYLCTIRSDGSDKKVLAKGVGIFEHFLPVGWSSDRNHILFFSHKERTRKLFMIDGEGNKRVLREFKEPIPKCALSSQNKIAFITSSNQLYLMDMDSNNVEHISSASALPDTLAFSPDGAGLLFGKYFKTSGNGGYIRTAVLDLQSRREFVLEMVTRNANWVNSGNIICSTNGKTADRVETEYIEIFDKNLKHLERILEVPYLIDMAPSPIRHEVAFIPESGTYNNSLIGNSIVLLDLGNLRKEVVVTDKGLHYVDISWSLDGQKISYRTSKTAERTAWVPDTLHVLDIRSRRTNVIDDSVCSLSREIWQPR